MTRVAIYARVRTAEGQQEVENQRAELRRFALTQNWKIAGEYVQNESGSRADRTEFGRLFADAAERRFDLVLVWALDRFAREGVGETFEHIRRLAIHGVQFVSFTEKHFRTTGPAGELMIAVADWIAKQERVRISERVRAGLTRTRLHGTRSGNPIGRPKALIDGNNAMELRNAGKSWREIACACGVGVTTVRRACSSMANK
jgi:DNA invertase Pin-like site-specific DNA recombinase